MTHALKTIAHLIRLDIKARMEYRGALLIECTAMFFAYSTAYAAIWVLLDRFDELGGWSWPELALLLSFQLLAYALGASLSFVQFRRLDDMVREGKFDVLLVKPLSPWTFLTFSGLNIGYGGHIVLAVGLMVWSLTQMDATWTLGSAAYFVAALLSGCLVVAAVMTSIGASAMVLVQSNYLYNIFFGFWQLTRYPIHIYPLALQWMLVTVVPLGYMNYVPVAVFLGKPVAILGGAGPALSLLAGPASVAAAVWFWRWCIRHYQGGGG